MYEKTCQMKNDLKSRFICFILRSCVGEQVKSKLIKIEGSAEHGISREEAMSRHAKLVLAAVSKTPVYKTVTTDSSKKPEPRSAPPTFKKRKVTVSLLIKMCRNV